MQFPSKIYIDGGDPSETREADEMLKKAGYHGLDGQTTNPSLIAKNLATSRQGEKVTMQEAFDEYKRIVTEMSAIIPDGKISIQVIGDPATMTKDMMLTQARERLTWIPNAIIKLPCTKAGIEAAEVFCQEGPINITLNFSEEQGAAVYSATKSHTHEVFISPFVGRFDDRGEKGMDFIANELAMLSKGDGHIQVITASVRNMQHLLYALKLKSHIITIPFKVFKLWADAGYTVPGEDYIYNPEGLTELPFHEVSLDNDWKSYDIHHALTDSGVAKFWEDWKAIVE
jgi:transaldolase